MDDVHEVALRGHDRVDGFVGGRGLVDHARVLAALDPRGGLLVVGQSEPPLGLGPVGALAASFGGASKYLLGTMKKETFL